MGIEFLFYFQTSNGWSICTGCSAFIIYVFNIFIIKREPINNCRSFFGVKTAMQDNHSCLIWRTKICLSILDGYSLYSLHNILQHCTFPKHCTEHKRYKTMKRQKLPVVPSLMSLISLHELLPLFCHVIQFEKETSLLKNVYFAWAVPFNEVLLMFNNNNNNNLNIHYLYNCHWGLHSTILSFNVKLEKGHCL